MDSGDRSFTVVQLLKPAQKDKKTHTAKKTKLTAGVGGRFVSKSPESAARKAFSQACREKKIKGQCTLIVKIQETTAGSKKKVFSYRMKRVKLSTPVKVNRGGVEILIKYTVESKSMN